MIKVHKNLAIIPHSLLNDKVIEKREHCIENKQYDNKFNSKFKQKDTKKLLSQIYYNKCAFCEQKIFKCMDDSMKSCSSTVEHYRPKSIYYWLAFSWDNLLWCCHRCNQNKDNKFDIKNSLGDFKKATFLKKIHNTSEIYNRIEKPLMVHPEIDSVLSKLSFENGIISSIDERVKYTIETCKLDRDDLNEKRLKILGKFRISAKKRNRLNKSYEDILDNLKKDFMNEKSEFRALKFWILKNHKSLIEEI